MSSPISASSSLVALHAQSLTPSAPLNVDSDSDAPAPVKRKRGRPRKYPIGYVRPPKPPAPIPQVPNVLHKLMEKARLNRRMSTEEKQQLRWFKRRSTENVYERAHRMWRALLLRREMDLLISDRDRRIRKWKLPPHMERSPPPLPEVERPAAEVADKVEQKLMRQYLTRCTCATCARMYRELKTANKYVCCVFTCKHKFVDIADLIEHQLDTHGLLTPFCRRIREEFFKQHQGKVADPPETVYARMQADKPWERPTRWTVEQVDQEFLVFTDEVKTSKVMGARSFLYTSFKIAYERIKLYGDAEINEQYRVALEYYESALMFPTTARSHRDVFGNVGAGRNWLLSPEPENAERTRLLKIAIKEARGAERECDGWESDSDEEEVLLDEKVSSPTC